MKTLETPSIIREICAIVQEQALDEQTGHDIRVTVLRGGTSINGYCYDAQALQAVARMIEGAQAYTDHCPPDQVTRSVRDMIGFYKDAAYVPPGPADVAGRVDATLHVLESADWLWSIIREAFSLGRPDLIGLSIDIFGQWQMNESTRVKEVTKVVALNSCDIVTRPSAGGTMNRILHSRQPERVALDAAASLAGGIRSLLHSHNHSEISSFLNDHDMGEGTAMEEQQMLPTMNDDVSTSKAPAEAASNHETMVGEMGNIREQRHRLEALIVEVKKERCALALERRLQESVLPEAIKQQLRARFTGRIFEDQELERELSASLGMMAELTKTGIVRGHGYERPDIGTQITEAEKMQAAFDAMFDLDIDRARLGNIRGFTSIREAYARVTGDSNLAAGISGLSQLGSIRVAESAPLARITEADTTTASFSYLLGTSMNKRLLKDYQAWPAEWQKFCSIIPIRDFKQQTRVRLGAFGSLPIVAEDTAYSAVTLSDSAATYVPQKRGNLVTVSRETIINDDLQAIKQIPTKLAVAAAYTLAEFVYGFLTSNPTIYDSNPLFTSGAPHSNLASNTLSSAAMQSGIIAMREQANYAGKRIGLRPRYLVVPPELEFVAMVATKSAGVPGSPNNDINPMLGYVTPIVAPQISSGTQWYMVGDPREIDTVEIGFVGGQVNPALFIQDQPLFGLNFTQDAITYKIRHEYGGCVVDYRGLYRGN